MASQVALGLGPAMYGRGRSASAPPTWLLKRSYFGFAVFVSTLTAGDVLPFVMSTWTAGPF